MKATLERNFDDWRNSIVIVWDDLKGYAFSLEHNFICADSKAAWHYVPLVKKEEILATAKKASEIYYEVLKQLQYAEAEYEALPDECLHVSSYAKAAVDAIEQAVRHFETEGMNV